MGGGRALPTVRAALHNALLSACSSRTSRPGSAVGAVVRVARLRVPIRRQDGSWSRQLRPVRTGTRVAPLAGSAADGPRPHRVLTTVHAARAGSLAIAAVVAYAGGPLVAVILAAATALMVLSFIHPCISVVVQVGASADAPVVAIRLLRRIPVFAPLPGPSLEGVARAARFGSVTAGTTIIREGDRGHHCFAIVAGEVEVSVAGERVRTMGRGEGFGEVALLWTWFARPPSWRRPTSSCSRSSAPRSSRRSPGTTRHAEPRGPSRARGSSATIRASPRSSRPSDLLHGPTQRVPPGQGLASPSSICSSSTSRGMGHA